MRLVGLPGDKVEISSEKVVLNGTVWDDPHAVIDPGLPLPPALSNFGPVQVPAHSFFVLGDNRRRSKDTEVEILNPIQGKERSEDKLVVLDVLARDAEGRRFNIEMQSTIPSALPQRLTFYNCLNYVRQISQGEGYRQLRPAISICVLGRELFPDVAPYHLSFRLRCDQTDLVLIDDLEFHTLELPKFSPSSHNVRELPAVEKWLYLMQHAPEMDADELADLLGDEALREAIGVLEMISKSPEDQQFYEARLKFLRDQEALRLDQEANLEAARQEGKQEGLEEGMERGMEEGIAKGRESGLLTGKIIVLQELLGGESIPAKELESMTIDELTSLLSSLQAQLRERK